MGVKMGTDGESSDLGLLLDAHRDLVLAGYQRAVACHGEFEVSFEEFSRHVGESVGGRLCRSPGSAKPDAVREVLEKTHLEDLYLALAMVLGRERAWVRFQECFGTFLLATCFQITRNRDRAEEVVGNILGDLFFTDRPRGASRIQGYNGASSIQRWLWLVLQSRVVDSVRLTAREGPSEDAEGILDRLEAGQQASADGRPEARALAAEAERLLKSVLPTAFQALDTRDRLLMKMHFLDRVQQKELARLYRVDTSRVCRWLERACRLVQRVTCEQLVLQHGMEPREAAEMAAEAVGDGCGSLLRGWLKGTDEAGE
jgi:RNA polymerase sigma factor (sigma-70 family)